MNRNLAERVNNDVSLTFALALDRVYIAEATYAMHNSAMHPLRSLHEIMNLHCDHATDLGISETITIRFWYSSL